jgi:LPS O-antigen subunit length determinant protein (WzzB/FepE family)
MEAMRESTERIAVMEDEIDLRELAATVGKHKKKLIAFTIVIVVGSILWTLSKPNVYSSQAILVPQEQSKTANLGGLSALAGMAGVDIGGGEMSADKAYQIYLNDYVWMRKFLVETKLFGKINDPKRVNNYRFARNIDTFYRFSNNRDLVLLNELNDAEKEKLLFATYKKVQASLSISTDKLTSAITLSYSDPDAELAKEVVESFLGYASSSLRQNELLDMEKKISYYEQELSKTSDLALKTQLSQLMSALIQKKVLAQSSEYYNVKVVTPPSVSYVDDKIGPKRGLIVMVSLVTSLILGIFGIFFLEFITKKSEESAA